MEKVELIEPIEWSEMHLDHHKQINIVLYWIFDTINNIQKDLWSFKNVKKDISESMNAQIERIVADISLFKNSIETKIDDLLSRIEKPIEREIIIKEYEWILDTESTNTIELEAIEFSKNWEYKVDVVWIDVDTNKNVSEYLMPQSDIKIWKFIPKIWIKSSWGKAVIQYKFKVLAYEI